MQSEIHERYNLSSVYQPHVQIYSASLHRDQNSTAIIDTRRNNAWAIKNHPLRYTSRAVIAKLTYERRHFLFTRKHDIIVPIPIAIEIGNDKSAKLVTRHPIFIQLPSSLFQGESSAPIPSFFFFFFLLIRTSSFSWQCPIKVMLSEISTAYRIQCSSQIN